MDGSSTFAGRRTHTYSIVALDPKTGEMGVAVQSHWFSVGSVVSWAEAGVGAVAIQSLVEVSFGPRGLELLTEILCKMGYISSDEISKRQLPVQD